MAAARAACATPIAAALRSGSVRAKLVLGGASDPQESEADRVAERVVSMPAPGLGSRLAPGLAGGLGGGPAVRRENSGVEEPEERAGALRRQEQEEEEETLQTLRRSPAEMEEEEVQTLRRAEAAGGAGPEEEPAVEGGGGAESGGEVSGGEESDGAEGGQLEEPSKDEMEALAGEVQAKASPAMSEGGEVSPGLAARIRRPGSGRPLDAETRAFMEPRFRADFSGVRVHDGPGDRETAARLGARAFAHGSGIWLGPNERTSDRRLMAHELTHVVQNKPGLTRGRAGPVRSVRASGAESAVRRVLGWLPDWAREKLAGWAAHVPGYSLLTFILGQNPITGKAVERNAINLVGAVMGLIPGGTKLFQLLKDSGALQKFFTWVSGAFAKLNLSLSLFVGLIKRAWDGVSITYSLSRNIQVIKDVFAPTMGRIWTFLKSLATKVMEFVFEGAMSIAGPLATRVFGVIKKAGSVITQIINDPIGFIGNLVKALLQGFRQFSSNILEHLKKGLFAWLFGTLGDAGLTLPEKFDLKGIVSIVTQVLGLTYQRIRAKLVKVLGEKRVALFEKGIEILRVLVTEGVAGVWRKLVEYMGSLKELVIGKIRDWVVTKIVTAAVTKLVSMFNPAGAIIQAVIAIYNTVVFFVERIKQIADLVESVFSSIGAIAAGKLSAAASFVEQSMARTIPVIIGFLARLAGLGGISAKIKDIIKSIQKKVDKAIDKVIGFIVKKGKALWGKAKATAAAAAKKLLGIKPVPLGPDGDNHTLKVDTSGKRSAPQIHSYPQQAETFIAEAENDATIDASRKKRYLAKSREALTALQSVLAEYDAAKARMAGPAAKRPTSKELQDLQSRVDSANAKLVNQLRLLVKGRGKTVEEGNLGLAEKRRVLLSRYRFEGLTGLYKKMVTEVGDEFSPDHQPSNAVLEAAAELEEFQNPKYGASKGTLKSAVKNHSFGAETVNLHDRRHQAGRTFGNKNKPHIAAFKSHIAAERQKILSSNSSDTPQQRGQKVRTMVIAALAGELRDDVSAMKQVVGGNTAWGDIDEFYQIPDNAKPEEKKSIEAEREAAIRTVRGQVLAGEGRIAGQSLDRYKD